MESIIKKYYEKFSQILWRTGTPNYNLYKLDFDDYKNKIRNLWASNVKEEDLNKEILDNLLDEVYLVLEDRLIYNEILSKELHSRLMNEYDYCQDCNKHIPTDEEGDRVNGYRHECIDWISRPKYGDGTYE